jgi:tetratricopeptide (TPR) repeat protein
VTFSQAKSSLRKVWIYLLILVVPESFNFDLFISYSRHDNGQGYISELVTRIQKEYRDFTGGEELRVFFEKDEIGGRDDWQLSTLDGIRSSRLLLACLSPNYLESEYSSWEFHEYLRRPAHEPLVESIGPIYFVEIPARSDKGFEQRAAEWVTEFRHSRHFEFRPWFDEGAADLKEAAIKALLNDANAQICDPSSRRVIDAKGNLDRHNEHFAGRSAELCRLREMVALGKVGMLTAINGLDGVGKTTLAIEYSHAFAHEYPGGCWQVRCQGREDLRVALASLAGVRDLECDFTEEEKRSLDLGFKRVLAELKQRADSAKPSRVLLLLDNIDQPNLLEPEQVRRLPRAEWLHIIATTRLDEYELFGRQKDRAFLTLNKLPEEEAMALIESYQSGGKFPDEATRDIAKDIVRLLGGFTLAVEAAAAFLNQFAEDVSCAAFHDRLKSEGLTDMEDDAVEPSEHARLSKTRLGATLRPTLERLGEAERMTLSFAALLPADHAALPWVRALVAQAYPELGEDALHGSPDPWQHLLQRLFSLRLLQATAGHYEARMHRLIQEMLKLDAGAQTVAVRERALLARVMARAEFLWDGWVQHEHRWELDPLVAFAWHWLERGATEGAYLANQAFGPLRNLGNFAEAEPLMRRALAVDERSFGPNHPNVATCLNNLAALLHDTNRLDEAEPLYRRALAIDELSFGAHEPKVATCLNNLAQLLQATDRLEESESLYRRALAIDENGLGPSHPRVAVHLNNLAELLKATNRLDEAEPFYRRALAIDENGLGPNHPRVASHLNNLAQLLQAINRPDEARALYRRALAIDELSFGPNHPRVATHLNNLALLLKATDQLEEAEPLYRRALAIDEQSFGPDHPNVGTDLNNLAALLAATNRLDEAESLMRLMVGIFLRSSASTVHEHPFLQTAMRNYAALLGEMGRSTTQILARLNELARPFEINFSSGALSEIARQCQERPTVRSQPALSGYRTALTFLLRKAVALLGFTGSAVHREEQKRRRRDHPQ